MVGVSEEKYQQQHHSAGQLDTYRLSLYHFCYGQYNHQHLRKIQLS